MQIPNASSQYTDRLRRTASTPTDPSHFPTLDVPTEAVRGRPDAADRPSSTIPEPQRHLQGGVSTLGPQLDAGSLHNQLSSRPRSTHRSHVFTLAGNENGFPLQQPSTKDPSSKKPPGIPAQIIGIKRPSDDQEETEQQRKKRYTKKKVSSQRPSRTHSAESIATRRPSEEDRSDGSEREEREEQKPAHSEPIPRASRTPTVQGTTANRPCGNDNVALKVCSRRKPAPKAPNSRVSQTPTAQRPTDKRSRENDDVPVGEYKRQKPVDGVPAQRVFPTPTVQRSAENRPLDNDNTATGDHKRCNGQEVWSTRVPEPKVGTHKRRLDNRDESPRGHKKRRSNEPLHEPAQPYTANQNAARQDGIRLAQKEQKSTRQAPPASTRRKQTVQSEHCADRSLEKAGSATTNQLSSVPLPKRPPLNLSNIVKENLPPWCSTAEDHTQNALRLRLSIIAASWFMVHEHSYEAIFDRYGKVWVRKGRPVVVPLGGQRVTYGYIYPPPNTFWATSICHLMCNLARNSSFSIDCPEAIGCIATYEGTPIQEVKHAMLPVGLFNSFALGQPSGSGLKVVNGWMVFRTWFLNFIRDWSLSQTEVSALARAAYSTQRDKPHWKNIGRTWTYFRDHCTFLQEKHSFPNFIILELKKYRMFLTPLDILRQANIPEESLQKLIPKKKTPIQELFRSVEPQPEKMQEGSTKALMVSAQQLSTLGSESPPNIAQQKPASHCPAPNEQHGQIQYPQPRSYQFGMSIANGTVAHSPFLTVPAEGLSPWLGYTKLCTTALGSTLDAENYDAFNQKNYLETIAHQTVRGPAQPPATWQHIHQSSPMPASALPQQKIQRHKRARPEDDEIVSQLELTSTVSQSIRTREQVQPRKRPRIQGEVNTWMKTGQPLQTTAGPPVTAQTSPAPYIPRAKSQMQQTLAHSRQPIQTPTGPSVTAQTSPAPYILRTKSQMQQALAHSRQPIQTTTGPPATAQPSPAPYIPRTKSQMQQALAHARQPIQTTTGPSVTAQTSPAPYILRTKSQMQQTLAHSRQPIQTPTGPPVTAQKSPAPYILRTKSQMQQTLAHTRQPIQRATGPSVAAQTSPMNKLQMQQAMGQSWDGESQNLRPEHVYREQIPVVRGDFADQNENDRSHTTSDCAQHTPRHLRPDMPQMAH